MSRKSTRRHFLKTTAALGVGAGLGWDRLRPERVRGANGRLRIGVIGVGGRGGGNLKAVAGEEILALCDIDTKQLQAAGQRFKEAKLYVDYRQLLQHEKLEAVVISTPDHHHAPATVRALRRGLHVYCEKPLTHTVHEAAVVRALARKMKVATQMGTQLHAREGYLRAVELVRAGAIGAVHDVHVITDRPVGWWPQGQEPPTGGPPQPKHIKWDLWLGPARARPYNPAYMPFRWRGWWDFGCGAIGDMAVHLMDCAFWGLELGGPVRVTSKGSPVLAASGPTWMQTLFEFEARGPWSAVKLHWYEGKVRPPKEIAKELPMNGALFVGQKGRVAVQHGALDCHLLPAERFKGYRWPKKSLKRPPEHHQEWIQACKQGGTTGSNFDYAAPFTAVVLLGNVSYRAGQSLRFDPHSHQLTGSKKAQDLLTKSYREGWAVE